MTKGDLVLLCFLILGCTLIVGLALLSQSGDMEGLEAENQELKEAIGRIYEKSLSMRISMELGMSEVARQLWKEKLSPAIQDALELCKEE